jgi:DUF971 family protein
VRIDKVQPETEYVLRLSYADLHDLYHMMLELSRAGTISFTSTEDRFFEALRAHA